MLGAAPEPLVFKGGFPMHDPLAVAAPAVTGAQPAARLGQLARASQRTAAARARSRHRSADGALDSTATTHV